MGDLAGLIASVRGESRAWRDDVRRMGAKHAALRRLRHHAGTEWLAARVDGMQPELADQQARLATAEDRVHRLEQELAETRAALAAHADDLQGAASRIDSHERELRVRAVMDWIAMTTPASAPLISVVLPTRDRAELLPRAVASVKAQSYEEWELVIVDDASTDSTPGVIESFLDDRIRGLRGTGRGACAARNLALEAAKGELVAYLDDDNVMHPEWLKSVVWAFEQRPEFDVLYGAFVVDDVGRIDGRGGGDLPRLFFHSYDHHAVSQHNIADMGAMAHRAGLAEAHFDESLREMGDWDLFLRLTRDRPPLALPAVACFYTTDAPNRLSHGPTWAVDADTVRAKNRR